MEFLQYQYLIDNISLILLYIPKIALIVVTNADEEGLCSIRLVLYSSKLSLYILKKTLSPTKIISTCLTLR